MIIVIDGLVVFGKGMFVCCLVDYFGLLYLDIGFIYWVVVVVFLVKGLLFGDEVVVIEIVQYFDLV